ncbi:MAG: cell division protein SepF [Clostridia bacterium]|jgi:cell division inhibitor SepF|nr:cell division protein SepF [Clostridia bacterium]MBR2944895.1 cell division protein SepF [Clostridia bacterium]
MGLFDIFKKKKVDAFEDEDEEFETTGAHAHVAPEVAIEGQVELKICKPKTFEQSLSAIDYLVAGRTVLLNLEDIDKTLYRRIIDFISGAAYALGLTIKKATNDSYFIAPREVDVSGEIFDTPDADEEFFTI